MLAVFLTILGAGVGLCVGGVLGFFAVYGLGLATGADTQQGALAMGAATTGLPGGAFVGAILGSVLMLRLGKRLGAKKPTLPQSLAALGIVFAALAGLYLNFFYEPPRPYYTDTASRPVLQAEIRLPVDMVDLEFIKGRRSMIRTYENTYYDGNILRSPRQVGEQIVLTALQPLIFRRANRSLHLWVSPKRLLIFDLDLPDDPPARPEFTDWQQVSGMRPGFYEDDVREEEMSRVQIRHKIKRGPN